MYFLFFAFASFASIVTTLFILCPLALVILVMSTHLWLSQEADSARRALGWEVLDCSAGSCISLVDGCSTLRRFTALW